MFKQAIKNLIAYINTYKGYGLYLYILVYWVKKKSINLGGYGIIHIRHNTFDADVFTQIFIKREYDFYVQHANEVKVIFDLGANNGMSALFFHKKYPDATIYAVEPEKSNFEALKTNTVNIKQIIAINKAVWKEDGFVNLDSGDSWGVKVDMELGGNKVEAITIGTLMSTYSIDQIDLLKIDIETAEKEVFNANTDFLKQVKNITIELHDWITPGTAQPFFKSLYNYNYNFYMLGENNIITDIEFKQDS